MAAFNKAALCIKLILSGLLVLYSNPSLLKISAASYGYISLPFLLQILLSCCCNPFSFCSNDSMIDVKTCWRNIKKKLHFPLKTLRFLGRKTPWFTTPFYSTNCSSLLRIVLIILTTIIAYPIKPAQKFKAEMHEKLFQ